VVALSPRPSAGRAAGRERRPARERVADAREEAAGPAGGEAAVAMGVRMRAVAGWG
jgi:hypothetical protein